MENLPSYAERVEHNLRAELERTNVLYKQERAHFKSVTREVPSGIPYPDSVMRITQAAERHNHAIDAYMAALRRFNDYVIRGIIPGDLKP